MNVTRQEPGVAAIAIAAASPATVILTHDVYMCNSKTRHSSNSDSNENDMSCNRGCNKHSCGCLHACTYAEETAWMLTLLCKTATVMPSAAKLHLHGLKVAA